MEKSKYRNEIENCIDNIEGDVKEILSSIEEAKETLIRSEKEFSLAGYMEIMLELERTIYMLEDLSAKLY